MKGRITDKHLPLAETWYPGIRRFYKSLTGAQKPRTFLDLVWAFSDGHTPAQCTDLVSLGGTQHEAPVDKNLDKNLDKSFDAKLGQKLALRTPPRKKRVVKSCRSQ